MMAAHPMVEQVDRLVGNLLAGGGEIFLPGVGSLYPEWHGAKRLSKRTVQPPFRTVGFSSQQRGVSLVDEIARVIREASDPALPDGADAQAQEIYARWLDKTRVGDVLTVAGVGVLKQKHFALDADFDRRINPQGREPVRLKYGHRFDWALAVGGAAMLVAALIGGYEFLTLYPDEGGAETAVAENAGAVAEETASGPFGPESSEKTGFAAEGSGAEREPDAGMGTDSRTDETTLRASGTTLPADKGAAETLPTGKSAAGSVGAPAGRSGDHAAHPASPSDRPAAKSAANAAKEPGTNPVPQSGTNPVPSAAQPASQPAGSVEAPARLVSGRRYVVLGVFSTPENAGRAARSAVRKDGTLRCGIYRFGEKFMVSPFESDDAAACSQFIHAHAGDFPGMWTYTAR